MLTITQLELRCPPSEYAAGADMECAKLRSRIARSEAIYFPHTRVPIPNARAASHNRSSKQTNASGSGMSKSEIASAAAR